MIAGHLRSGSTGIKTPRQRLKSQNSGEVEDVVVGDEFDEGDADHGLTDIRTFPLLPSQFAFVPPRRDSFPVEKLLSGVVFCSGRLRPVAVSQLAVCSALAQCRVYCGWRDSGSASSLVRPRSFFAGLAAAMASVSRTNGVGRVCGRRAPESSAVPPRLPRHIFGDKIVRGGKGDSNSIKTNHARLTLLCPLPSCPMLFRGSFVALAATLFSSVVAISPGFPYGSQKVRGVNLGGWLVL